MGNGLGDPAEPTINVVRRGNYGEISFAHKDNSRYIRDTKYVKRWIKSGPWACLFDLEDFVSETKDTIFSLLDDVQRNHINGQSKAYAEKLSIMALSLNVYPKLD